MNYLVEGVIGRSDALTSALTTRPWRDIARSDIVLPLLAPSRRRCCCSACSSGSAGVSPVEVWLLLFKGAFGDWFSWQNTLQRAAPLMLTALCVALPARAGLVIIGGEGALVLGGLACAALPYAVPLPGNVAGTALVCVAGALAGAPVDRAGRLAAPVPRRQRDHQQPAAGLHRHRAVQAFVEGPLRDPASLNKPSTCRWPRACASAASAAPTCTGAWCSASSPASACGAVAALDAARLRHARGRRQPARRAAGGPAGDRLILIACALGGACAGLAGAIEVAAVHTSANASLIAG